MTHLEREMEWAAKEEAIQSLERALRYLPESMFFSKGQIRHAINLLRGEQVPAKWGDE